MNSKTFVNSFTLTFLLPPVISFHKKIVNYFVILPLLLLMKEFKFELCSQNSRDWIWIKISQIPKPTSQIQFSSVAQSCPTLCDPMKHSTPGLPVHHYLQSLLKFMSTELVMPSNHVILCHPLLLPSIFPSIMLFSNESALRIKWPKYWSFGFSISPSNEYSGLIPFRMDWFDRLAVQGTLKSLLQHKWMLPWLKHRFTKWWLEIQIHTMMIFSINYGSWSQFVYFRI